MDYGVGVRGGFGSNGTLGRETSWEVASFGRLRAALERLNPSLPAGAIAAAVDKIDPRRFAHTHSPSSRLEYCYSVVTLFARFGAFWCAIRCLDPHSTKVQNHACLFGHDAGLRTTTKAGFLSSTPSVGTIGTIFWLLRGSSSSIATLTAHVRSLAGPESGHWQFRHGLPAYGTSLPADCAATRSAP